MYKKFNFLIICLVIGTSLFSQEMNKVSGLQKNLNVKMGILGAWMGYEMPLDKKNFLISIETGYVGGIVNGEVILTSIVEIEPRYYHNVSRRITKGKKIKNNSANYFAIELSYLPDIFTVDSFEEGEIKVVKSFNAIPTYGLRRNISGNLNFDFEIGIGYQWTEFEELNGIVPNLLLGFSYMF